MGAAAEAALNGVPAIGVSLCNLHLDADFSAVEQYFGEIFERLMANYPKKHGLYYNVNFPDIPADQIKGAKVGTQGMGRWVREFQPWDEKYYQKYGITPEMLGQSSNPVLEEGEDLYMMVGDFEDDQRNPEYADHRLLEDGYISIVAHNIDCTDYEETERLRSTF